jgi:hypothetical protein
VCIALFVEDRCGGERVDDAGETIGAAIIGWEGVSTLDAGATDRGLPSPMSGSDLGLATAWSMELSTNRERSKSITVVATGTGTKWLATLKTMP